MSKSFAATILKSICLEENRPLSHFQTSRVSSSNEDFMRLVSSSNERSMKTTVGGEIAPPQGDALCARNPSTVLPLISPWRAGVLLKRRSNEPQIRGDMPRRPAYTGAGLLCHSPHQRRRPSRKELQAAAIVWCGESASITVRCVAICRRGARAALRCRDAPTPLLSKEWGPPHRFEVGTAASKLTALQDTQPQPQPYPYTRCSVTMFSAP